MKSKSRRVRASLLAGALSFSLLAPGFAAEDISGHWASQALSTWQGYGVIQGDNHGNLNPDQAITRAELAVMLDRVMDYQVQKGSYTDLDNSWYTEAILGASGAGILTGYTDGTVKPGAAITRQEAAVMFARVLDLDDDSAAVSVYRDAGQIGSWAKGAVGALTRAGYLQGADGLFRPESSITRAEVVTILDNIFASNYHADGTYTGTVDGSAVVNADDVLLEDMAISGDLIIAEGVADGHVELNNVTVEGRLIVRGGGIHSVIIRGDSRIGEILVARQAGGVRVAVEGSAQVETITVTDGADEVRIEGEVGSLVIEQPDVEVTLDGTVQTLTVSAAADGAQVTVAEGAQVETLTLTADDAQLTVAGTIGAVTVTGADATITAQSTAQIDSVTTSAAGTTIQGSGQVEQVEAAQGATGTTVTTEGTKVENNSTGSVTVPDGSIAAGESGTTTGGTTTTPGGGSGGSGGSSQSKVDGVYGVSPVDQDDPGTALPAVTANATKGSDGNVTVKLSTSQAIPLHANAQNVQGYWVGVAFQAPEDFAGGSYYFSHTAYTDQEMTPFSELDTLTEDRFDGPVDGKYFIAYINAGDIAPKTTLVLDWDGEGTEYDKVVYTIDLSGVKTGVKTIASTAASQSQFPEQIESTADGLSRDESAELTGKTELSQEEVAAFGGQGGQYVTYYTISREDVPAFTSIRYWVNDGQALDWAVPSTTGANEGGGWWTTDDNNYYFKLGNTFATQDDNGFWSMKDGGKFNHTVQFVQTDGSYNTVVATLTFTVDLSGVTITGTDPVAALQDELNQGDAAVSKNLTIPAGQTLTVPTGKKLTVQDNATLTVQGTLVVEGTLDVKETLDIAQGGALKGAGTQATNDGAASLAVAEGGSLTIAGTEEGGLETTIGGSTGTVTNTGEWTLTDGIKLNIFPLTAMTGTGKVAIYQGGILCQSASSEPGELIWVGQGGALIPTGDGYVEFYADGMTLKNDVYGTVESGRNFSIVESEQLNVMPLATMTIDHTVALDGTINVSADGTLHLNAAPTGEGTIAGVSYTSRLVLGEDGIYNSLPAGTYVYDGGKWMLQIFSQANRYEYADNFLYSYSIGLEGATVSYAAPADAFQDTEPAEDGNSIATADLARFLGAIYRVDDGQTVQKITYDGTDYTWNTQGTLRGSNWENEGTTLVSVISQACTTDLSDGSASFTFTFNDMTQVTLNISVSPEP